MSKRSCYPACPKPRPPKIIKIEKPCKLPPRLRLPAVRRSEAGCPAEHACYDKANAGALAHRLSKMKDWIVETRQRCGVSPQSQPTSKPAVSKPKP